MEQVEVGLAQLVEGAVVVVQPDEEAVGGGQGRGGAVAAAGGERAAAGGRAQGGQLVPGEELAQQPGVVGVGERGELVVGPLLEQEELPVAVGERPGLHEQVAQVSGGARAGQGVQRLVGERDLAAGEPAQGRRDVRVVVDPDQAAAGFGHRDELVGEDLQGRVDPAGAVVEQLVQPLRERRAAAGAPPLRRV